MIGLEVLYVIGGAFFAAVAVLSARDASNPKRWKNTAFWGLFAVSFLFGSHLPDLVNGLIVIAMVLVAGFGGLGRGEPRTTTPQERADSAARLGNRLFLPALAIPATALAGTFAFKRPELGGLVDPKQATLVSLILGVFVALAVAMPMLRARPAAPLQEGRRLLDTVGWAAVLPQMLARKAGRILLMGSAAALRGMKRCASYSAARGAQIAWVRAAGVELARQNIQLNAIAQNFVDNPTYFPPEVQANPAFQERLKREVPLGRLVSAREDALFAVYLCSSAADCFVGQVFPMCGGWVGR